MAREWAREGKWDCERATGRVRESGEQERVRESKQESEIASKRIG